MYEDEIPVGKAKDLRGQVFGKLTVLYRYNKKDSRGNAYWKCRCECGNEVIVQGCGLKSGNTMSCGCLQKEKAAQSNSYDLIGKTFGCLKVLSKTNKKISGSYVYNCKCSCGNIIEVNTNALTSGHTSSCGCLKSKGEMLINKILKHNNIIFTSQQTFETCRQKTYLKFDFFINNSYLLEFDGIQHFKAIERFGGKKQFIIQQEYDAYKNQWCKDNNIPLIRIPYTKLDTLCIEDLMLETTQFRVV